MPRHEPPNVIAPQPPILAFLCGTCATPMENVCHHCQNREDEERDQERRAEAKIEARAREARAAIPGVTELQEIFDQDVVLDLDGEDGIFSAKIHIQGVDPSDGKGTTEAQAVDSLRREIVKSLRFTANDLEQSTDRANYPLLLEAQDLTDLLEILEKNSSHLASSLALVTKLRVQAGLPPLAKLAVKTASHPLGDVTKPPEDQGNRTSWVPMWMAVVQQEDSSVSPEPTAPAAPAELLPTTTTPPEPPPEAAQQESAIRPPQGTKTFEVWSERSTRAHAEEFLAFIPIQAVDEWAGDNIEKTGPDEGDFAWVAEKGSEQAILFWVEGKLEFDIQKTHLHKCACGIIEPCVGDSDCKENAAECSHCYAKRRREERASERVKALVKVKNDESL